MSSTSKIQASRENGRHSSGAKTPAGKRNSSRNSRKHGLFARELVVSDAERLELEALRRRLQEQLLPKTELQKIGVEEIVCCAWRCKLAARMEMQRVNIFLDNPKGEEAQPGNPEPITAMSKWYASGRQALRDGIRFLEHVKVDFEANGLVRDEWKESLDRGFGPEFYDLMIKWMPMSFDTILFANFMVDKSKMLGQSPFPDGKKPENIVIDPEQGRQMVLKLLELHTQHLQDLATSWDQRTLESARAQNVGAGDFAPRYFTTATRDLHRAVEWYSHLKEDNM